MTSPKTHGICSSGSTGTPKVILIDMPALGPRTPSRSSSGWIDVPRPQTVLVPAPMYHTNGFATLPDLLAGDRLVILEKFDAALVVDLVERHRITTFTATPDDAQRIADLPGIDDRDLRSLVWVLQGAAAIAAVAGASVDRPHRRRPLYMAYGMTEGLGLTALRADEWLEHPGSVGRGYRDSEIRILDATAATSRRARSARSTCARPPSGHATATSAGAPPAVTDDGFGTAGDLGHLDEDGFLYIADRRVDMIISGGANVFPAEVESALIDHDGIADVVVIGLGDPEWGRRVHALVEPRDPPAPRSEAEVIAFAKSRLAAYKVPKSVELVDQIPRSAATKVSRKPSSTAAALTRPRRPGRGRGRGRGGLAGQLRPSCAVHDLVAESFETGDGSAGAAPRLHDQPVHTGPGPPARRPRASRSRHTAHGHLDTVLGRPNASPAALPAGPPMPAAGRGCGPWGSSPRRRCGSTQRGRPLAPDVHGRPRPLHGLGLEHDGVEREELAVVLDDLSVHSRRHTSMHSSTRRPRLAKSRPTASHSAWSQLAPMPSSTRPPDTTSSVATARAV